MFAATDLDAVVSARTDEERLARYPLQSAHSLLVRLPLNVLYPAALGQVPHRDGSVRRTCGKHSRSVCSVSRGVILSFGVLTHAESHACHCARLVLQLHDQFAEPDV